MATSQPPLDPRKYPWHYGDVVTLGFEKNGFVIDSTPEYLEVMWVVPGHVTERVPIDEVDNLLRLGHAASLSASGDKTNVEVLETMLTLDRMQTSIQKRMANCKTKAEEEHLNVLAKRCFDTEGCEWDRAHRAELLQLLIEPATVGLLFKIQERIHRFSCKKH